MKYLLTFCAVIFIGWIVYCADNAIENSFVSFARSFPFGDKIGHACLFGTFALLMNWVLDFRQINVLGFHLLTGAILVFLIALLEECSQLFFESRTFDWTDILFDFLGIGLLSFVQFYIKKGPK